MNEYLEEDAERRVSCRECKLKICLEAHGECPLEEPHPAIREDQKAPNPILSN